MLESLIYDLAISWVFGTIKVFKIKLKTKYIKENLIILFINSVFFIPSVQKNKISLFSSYLDMVKNTEIKKTNRINLLNIFGKDNSVYMKYTLKLCPSSETNSK